MNDSSAAMPAPGDTLARFIDGPAGRLEALLAAPKAAPPRGICVVCHPHPLFGGTMTNKVAWTLASSALKAGLLVARFNFRGVGRSAGLYDDSRGETDDALAVVAALRALLPQAPLLLAGFSFGAYVSLKAAAIARPAALIGISGPFGKYIDGAGTPPHPHCPWLTTHSADDDTVDFESTRRVLETYDPPPQFVRFDGAGHFYHGRLTDLHEVLQPFLEKVFAPSG